MEPNDKNPDVADAEAARIAELEAALLQLQDERLRERAEIETSAAAWRVIWSRHASSPTSASSATCCRYWTRWSRGWVRRVTANSCVPASN